ncbi:hypothetical protein JF729_07090 [Mycobacterium intracellulare]|uniref:ATP-binding protein n=1 Tax=Mycobacterium intracellulare TaxID=1767 RepID=UPI001CD9AFC8|nr:ATP-binding protein [Mycobacterium intracellulare]MCA2247561.1 hypothetical protein [Mycobacterium intracellulare]
MTNSPLVTALAVESNVWKTLALWLSEHATDTHAPGMLRAVQRLLDDAKPQPLFDGATMDHLPPHAHSVLLHGPIGSGKTVCARRIARQALAAGRHVTVIRTLNGPTGADEYAFPDANPESLTLIDAEPLRHQHLARTAGLQFLQDSLGDLGTIDGPHTLIIDAHIAPTELRDIALHLNALSARSDITVVLVALAASDLCEEATPTPIIAFDTIIALPGSVNTHPAHIDQMVPQLTSDDLTQERLTARLRGGGIATSRCEQQVLKWFSFTDPEYKYLAAHLSRIVEQPQPTITVGQSNTHPLQLRHGIMRTPTGKLAEFSLPPASDVPPTPSH